jgi:hypothetical protein
MHFPPAHMHFSPAHMRFSLAHMRFSLAHMHFSPAHMHFSIGHVHKTAVQSDFLTHEALKIHGRSDTTANSLDKVHFIA